MNSLHYEARPGIVGNASRAQRGILGKMSGDHVQGIIAKDRASPGLEVQARACEYSQLFNFEKLRTQLLEHMPALDEAHYSRNVATAAAIDMSSEPAAAQVTSGLPAC